MPKISPEIVYGEISSVSGFFHSVYLSNFPLFRPSGCVQRDFSDLWPGVRLCAGIRWWHRSPEETVKEYAVVRYEIRRLRIRLRW